MKILPSNTDSAKIKTVDVAGIFLKSDRKRTTTTTTNDPILTEDDAIATDSDNQIPNIDIDLVLNNNVIDTNIPKIEPKIKSQEPEEDIKTKNSPFLNPTNRFNIDNDVDVMISNDIVEDKMNTTKHLETVIMKKDFKVEITSTSSTTSKPLTTTTTKNTTPIPLISKNEINSNEVQYDDEDESDDSEEDFAVEWHGTSLVRRNKVRVHISNEVTLERGMPLRQGFLASTGYPNFYIGESNCSWTITAPIGHRIRLTVLDIHLRGKYDYIELKEKYFTYFITIL